MYRTRFLFGHPFALLPDPRHRESVIPAIARSDTRPLRSSSVSQRIDDADRWRAHQRELADRTLAQAAGEEMDDEFVSSIFPSLHRTAWKMTGDRSAAEDLAQETLIVAMQSWHSFDGRSSRSTWMHGILIRLARKHFRSLARLRRRIRYYLDNQQADGSRAETPDSLAESEWRESIWSQVAALPRSQAEAITLRFDQRLTYEQIGAIVNCPAATAKSRVHQGLRRLRQSPQLSETFDFV